jgi:hypothetical protein
MKSLFVMLATGFFTLALVAGAAQAGETPWFDRDKPSGVGEYETTKDLLKIECRFKQNPTVSITDTSHPGYHCNVTEGGWCKNGEAALLGKPCQDMEVRYKW